MSGVVLAGLVLAAVAAALPAPIFAQWSGEIQCSDSPLVFTYGQSYDFDADGKIHMVWQNWDDSTPNIYYANNLSGSWARSHVNNGSGQFIVITQADQMLHYFYRANDRTYYRTKPVAGGSWSSAVQIDANPEKGYINDVIVDPSGGIYVSWLHLFDPGWTPPSGAYGRYKPYGGSWGATEFVQGLTNDIWPQNLQLVADGSKIYASYRLTNYASGARYKVREAGVWSSEKLVTSNAYSCNLAVSPGGEIACVYSNPDPEPEGGTDWNVYAMFSGDGGLSWSREHVVMDNRDLCRSALAVYDDHGNLYVGYEGRVSESAKFSTYVRARIGSIWQPEEIVNNPSGMTPRGLRVHNNTLWCTYTTNHGISGAVNNVYLKYKALSNDWTATAPVTSFGATGGEKRVTLVWQNPGDADFMGATIRCSTVGYPTAPWKDREVCVRAASPGSVDSLVDYPLSASTHYYYSAFAQDTSGNWSVVATAVGLTVPDVTAPARPTAFTASPRQTGTMKLQWTNPNDIDFKGTMIRCKTTGYPTNKNDGTLVCSRAAAVGSSDSYDHSGLTVGLTYYYSAFAYDQDSNYSAAALATGVPVLQTCGFVKTLPDGAAVSMSGQVVTAIMTAEGCIYVAEPDRASGIRIVHSGSGVAVGDRVSVEGVMGTRYTSGYSAERHISSPTVTSLSSQKPLDPLAMNCKAVGGGPLPPYVTGVVEGTGEKGVGCNNIGSLVRIVGRVTRVITSYIYIDDGSDIQDIDEGGGVYRKGVMVRCPGAPGYLVGDVVEATGVVEGSIPLGWTANRRFVATRGWDDLALVTTDCANGAVAGTVRDTFGAAIVGATVTTDTGGYSTTSGSGGAYTLHGVSPATYDVTASATGYSPQTQYGVVVAAGATNTVDFTLACLTGSISGYVKGTSNNPISGASVSTNAGGYSTTSNADGSYALSNVAVGTYSVTASRTGYAPQTKSGITVQSGQTTACTFSLSATLTERLINGSFEGGFFNSGWWGGYCPNGWGFAWRGTPSQDWFYQNSYYAGGAHNWTHMIQGKRDNYEIGIAQQITGLTVGSSFAFSAESYKVGSNYTVYLAVRPGTGYGSEMGTTAGTEFPNTTGAWVSQTVTGTVGATGSVTVYLWVKRLSGSTQNVYFDNASFLSQ